MLARAHAFTIEELHTRHVTVEVDVRPGLPTFTIVGLADATVREARERVETAIRNSGYEFPARRITANLAPGDVPKAGPGLDLAIACAVLAASGQVRAERLETIALFGELALDGAVRDAHGTLAVAQATHRAGLACLALSPARAHEARLIDGLEVAAVTHLRSAVRVLEGGAGDSLAHLRREAPAEENPSATAPDLRDVRGQAHAVEALTIAAAGAHNMLLSGAPGTGKTMLAQRVCSILPPLDKREAIEVTRIHSLRDTRVESLARVRPFRAPHHTTTAAGLVGGARRGCVGEVVLAHNGVLFLDELSEFSRSALEALRQPLEDGRVAIARANHSAVYPARFMLLAATNPCPCGYASELERCGCTEAQMVRHARRLSGPLLDRVDLKVNLTRADGGQDRQAHVSVSSEQARVRVLEARERQARRLRSHGASTNAQLDVRLLREHVRLDEKCEGMMRAAHERGLLSVRGEHRTLRVARTIADLRGSERVSARDLGAALALRSCTPLGHGRVT